MKTFRILALLSVVPILFSAAAFAQDDRPAYSEPPLLIGEGVVPQTNVIEGQFFGVPGQSGESPTMSDERESGRFIVSKTAADTWSLNERVYHLGIGEPIAIPQTTSVVPQDLWSIDAGAGYNHRFENGRDLGFSFNGGSESDKPFYSIHETVFRVGANYRVPTHDADAWIFSLNYSNNRHFFNGIPLPGIAYYFQADDNRVQALIGFPYAALRYKPTPDWSLQASIFGPRNVNAEIARRLIGPLRIFTAFQWSSQEWLIADRPDYSDRLIFDRKRASLGIRTPVARGTMLELSGGRQFDQRFFVNSSSSYRDVPTEGLSPAWFMEAKLTYRFGPQ